MAAGGRTAKVDDVIEFCSVTVDDVIRLCVMAGMNDIIRLCVCVMVRMTSSC